MVITFSRSDEAYIRNLNIEGTDELNPEEMKGYQWVRLNGEISTREYANNFNYGYKKAQRHLSKMRQLDMIEDNGLPSTSPNYRYKVKTN